MIVLSQSNEGEISRIRLGLSKAQIA
jgi:hypothetical protein